MSVSYKILFAADIEHEYYADKKCTDFSIVPSAETAMMMKNMQLLCKTVGNKLIVLCRVNDNTVPADANKPLVQISSDAKFVFYMQLENPVFSVYTNIDNDAFKTKRYYFSNLFETKPASALYLSAPAGAYGNAVSYKPGDLVTGGGAVVFECVKTSTGNSTANQNFWYSRGANAYPGRNDMYEFVSTITAFTAKTAATSFNIEVFAFNAGTKLFDNKVLSYVHNAGTIATKNVPVDMRGLGEGRYILKINGQDYEGGTDAASNPVPFYLSDQAVSKKYTGIIEVFNNSTAITNKEFALLDADGKVKDTIVANKPVWLNFVIRFANKLATWKYISKQNSITEIKNTAVLPVFSFNKTTVGQQDFFESPGLIPMSQKPVKFDLLLTNAVSSQPPPAPNPDPHVTGMLSRSVADYYCTIYLNY
jgi:hypothetical protein